MDSISFWLYFGTTVWTASILVGATGFVLYIIACSSSDTSDCASFVETGIFLNALCFAILSLLLVGTVLPLFQALNKLQKGSM